MGGRRPRRGRHPHPPPSGPDQRRDRRGSPKNPKLLPHPLHWSGRGRNFNAAEREEPQQVCVSLAYWRPHVAGQRSAYAPPGAEAGRSAQGAVPRPPPHLRHPGPPERRGRENRQRNAGHFSAGFTLGTYAHVTTQAQRQAANTMGNILSAAV